MLHGKAAAELQNDSLYVYQLNIVCNIALDSSLEPQPVLLLKLKDQA